MELFLSLNKNRKKGKCSPVLKTRIIDIFHSNNISTNDNNKTIFLNYQRNSIPYKNLTINSCEKTFTKPKNKIIPQKINQDLVFNKISKVDNNTSITIDSEDEQKLISSLQEGIVELPNGKFMIQASKVLNMKLKNNNCVNYSNIKTETTKQSDNNTSITVSSSTNNFNSGLKKISIPFKLKNSKGSSSHEKGRDKTAKNQIRRISPKYARNVFNTFLAKNNTTLNNQSNQSFKSNNTTNKKNTQKIIQVYLNKYFTHKGN